MSSQPSRHSLEQLAHDVRNSAGLVSGALAEIRASLGPAADDQEVFLRIANRGVRQLLVLADRCAVEGERARSGAPTDGTGADLDATLLAASETAKEAFGKKSLQVEIAPSDAGARLRGSPRWIGVVLTECVLLALKSASKQVRLTALTDGEAATIAIESDGQRPLVEDDSAEGRALQMLSSTLAAMGGSVVSSPKAFRLLLTMPLLEAAGSAPFASAAGDR
jgi:signal transduction histidine kinase